MNTSYVHIKDYVLGYLASKAEGHVSTEHKSFEGDF